MGRGSRTGIYYVVENVSWGTTPATPAMQTLRRTTDTLGLRKSTYRSQEIRSDRMVAALRHGNKRPGGTINFEWSYNSQATFLESAFFGAFATTYSQTNKTISCDQSAKTFTMAAGGYLAAGVKIGDKITFGGYVNGGNNSTFVVSGVSDTVVTCSTATGLTTEAGGGNETYATTQTRLKAAATQKSLTLERAHADLTKYIVYTGWVAGSMSLSLRPDAIVTGSFSGICQDIAVNSSPLDAAPDAAPTGSPFDAFTGSILEGGSAIAIVTGLDLNLDNALSPRFVLFDDEATALVEGASNLTGTLSAYFDSETLLNKFINETGSSLEFTLLDTAGVGYRVTIPNIKYTGGDVPVQGEGDITISLPFQAGVDIGTSATGTEIYIDKLV